MSPFSWLGITRNIVVNIQHAWTPGSSGDIACLSTLYCVMYCQYSAVFVWKKNNPSITKILGLKHYLLLILIFTMWVTVLLQLKLDVTNKYAFGSNLCTSTYIVLSPFIMSFYFCIRQTIIIISQLKGFSGFSIRVYIFSSTNTSHHLLYDNIVRFM